MRDSEHMVSLLNQLQALGLRVAIDDFGTGFASLSYLKQLPVDGIKIDRTFILGIDSAERNSAITRGVLMIAKELGVRTIAEGVETEGERDFVIEHGTDLLQGYLFCRPQPLQEVLTWITAQGKG